jgi:hypothetical protein
LADEEDIRIGGNCLIFPKTKDKRPLVIEEGANPQPGDIIGLHPLTTNENNPINDITHGLNYFKEGDEVVIRKLKTKDEAAFKPGFVGMNDCVGVGVAVHHTQGFNNDGTVKYNEYKCALSEPFYRQDHDLNLHIKFSSSFGEKGMQPWFPYGGCAVGFSQDGKRENIYWHTGIDPLMVVSTSSILYFCGPKGFDPNYSDFISMGDDWCYPDALNPNLCNKRYGPAAVTVLPGDTPVNYVHLHIRHNSSTYWYNDTKTTLSTITACRGVATEVDPCPYMFGNQRCP